MEEGIIFPHGWYRVNYSGKIWVGVRSDPKIVQLFVPKNVIEIDPRIPPNIDLIIPKIVAKILYNDKIYIPIEADKRLISAAVGSAGPPSESPPELRLSRLSALTSDMSCNLVIINLKAVYYSA